ncbi:hypothetical protein RR51_03790 [Pseudomonas sp. C5pp]|nr:hypothetical protein RR51_03790 [Pseudomonas sp. C5pp]
MRRADIASHTNMSRTLHQICRLLIGDNLKCAWLFIIRIIHIRKIQQTKFINNSTHIAGTATQKQCFKLSLNISSLD